VCSPVSRLLTLLLALSALACTSEPARIPGSALRARAEARLEAERPELLASPGHYGLVFEVPQPAFMRFMAQIYLHRAEGDIVPGSIDGVEAHGGGVLALIVDTWRPHGEAPGLDDVFPFSWGSLALTELYRSHQRQVFLSSSGGLPRLRFRIESKRGVDTREADAYAFLATLLRFEDDLESEWTNRSGQSVTADRLLRSCWDRYRQERSPEEDSEDHSYLHLPGLLLAYGRHAGAGLDVDAVKRRFMSQELRRRSFGRYAASEALGHYAEALGLLVSDAAVTWTAEEKSAARGWLGALEAGAFPDVEGAPLSHLAHLVHGLREIERNRSRLE